VSDSPNWSHHNPVRIVCAPLETLSHHVAAQHVLLVTTPGFVKRGVAQQVKDVLAPQLVTVWDGVKPNPDLRDLDTATQSLRTLGIDCVVGLGGGSALDAAKVLATTIPSPAEPTLQQVFRGKAEATWNPRLPLVAIPTTSGTGAEVTPFATVWDHEEHQKHSLAGDFVYPDVALLDATLTLTLSEEDTLYPALDAISHAVESLWNKNCTPVSRAYAFQALAFSSEALPQVMVKPQNLKARQDLQNASVLAGLAISQTRTAIAHSISYPLTSHFGVPHGLACSFSLPYFINKDKFKLTKRREELDLLDRIGNIIRQLGLLQKEEMKEALPHMTSVMSRNNESARRGNYLFAEDYNAADLIEFINNQ
jgi:phosphonate metabolism-associated iron-containing alcohol dehydrogenase